MTVYVESNFVLEHSLQQEEWDSCDAILDLASKGRISLVVPALHIAIAGKEKARSRLSNDLRAQLGELGRSKPHRTVPATFEALVSVLITRAQFERDGVRETISALLSTADVIALDGTILRSAADIQVEFGVSGQDAIVLASVLSHLDEHKPPESSFFNRNSKDFDDPDVVETLERRGCRFFASFRDGLRYVIDRTESP